MQEKARKREMEPDLIEVIDGLCDTIVVSYGTAESIGIDLEPFYDEVMRTNMAKKDGPIDANGKRLKPPGWTPPDIRGVLAKVMEQRKNCVNHGWIKDSLNNCGYCGGAT